MSEDYKKITLEDVKKGQRVRVVERYPSYTATYEGVVVRTNTEWSEIVMGDEEYEIVIFVPPGADAYFDTFLLEDAPKPKVVRTATVKYYDDGTKTETPEAPECIEDGEWPENDARLRDYEWVDLDGDTWTWVDRGNRKSGWNWTPGLRPLIKPIHGPWTRGNRLKEAPKAGDVFTSIEDMPYGWIAKVTLGTDEPWGHVVRHDDGWMTHLWDEGDIFGETSTAFWTAYDHDSTSGGSEVGTLYTLVETVGDHDSRV